VRLALESRKYVQQEVEYRRKDGSVFIANLHMRVLRNDKNERYRLKGLWRHH